MPTTWNAESDAALFKAMVAWLPPPSQLSMEQRGGIVASMRVKGFSDVTWEGIRYVIRLPRLSKAQSQS